MTVWGWLNHIWLNRQIGETPRSTHTLAGQTLKRLRVTHNSKLKGNLLKFAVWQNICRLMYIQYSSGVYESFGVKIISDVHKKYANLSVCLIYLLVAPRFLLFYNRSLFIIALNAVVYFQTSVGCLGVCGNILCMVFFSRKLVQSTFHCLMLR